jgi:hypothetical protein
MAKKEPTKKEPTLTRFGAFPHGMDTNDVWRTRCAGMAMRDATPDEQVAWYAETRLTDESIAAAKASGFTEAEAAVFQDFILVRTRGDYHERVSIVRGVFKAELRCSFFTAADDLNECQCAICRGDVTDPNAPEPGDHL